MTVHSHSLPQRYGAPRPARQRIALVGIVLIIAVTITAVVLLWGRSLRFYSDPPVSSELITSEIVDDHTATAVIRVQWGDDPVDAKCTVRAIAHDKTIVGQQTFVPDQEAGPDYEVEIATERRATAVENIGCTADGQPRPG